jgi:hypothetical protein
VKTTAESRAQHVVDHYLREVAGTEPVPAQRRLQDLVTDAIHKAVTEDREAIRERMPCATDDPCAFEMCAHHKALIAAVMELQDGTAPAPRSLFSRPPS